MFPTPVGAVCKRRAPARPLAVQEGLLSAFPGELVSGLPPAVHCATLGGPASLGLGFLSCRIRLY